MIDVLVRFLEANGQRVRYVQNVTDVDDPLFERARRDGGDWRALAKSEVAVHMRHMRSLVARVPDFMPRVTGELAATPRTEKDLHSRGYAYKTHALFFHA